jgi:ppGpp synthetase/RelA/SpoT-type nucleotidyltranferase
MGSNREIATSPVWHAYGNSTPILHESLIHAKEGFYIDSLDDSYHLQVHLALLPQARSEFSHKMLTDGACLNSYVRNLIIPMIAAENSLVKKDILLPSLRSEHPINCTRYLHKNALPYFESIDQLENSITTMKLQEARSARPFTKSEYHTIDSRRGMLEEKLQNAKQKLYVATQDKKYHPIIMVQTRLKSPSSIASKIADHSLQYGYDDTPQLEDLCGVKLVVKSKEYITPVEEQITRELQRLNPGAIHKRKVWNEAGYQGVKLYAMFKGTLINIHLQTSEECLWDRQTHLAYEKDREIRFETARNSKQPIDKLKERLSSHFEPNKIVDAPVLDIPAEIPVQQESLVLS